MTNTNFMDCFQFDGLKLYETIGAEDWISSLPDELLSCILTNLPLKEAMATSILSRRWNKLWVSHPVLDFGCFSECSQLDLYEQRVNSILRQYDGPRLRKFRIVYPVSEYVGSVIDDWISFALENGVSELALDFPNSSNQYCIPTALFSLHTTSHVKQFEFVKDLWLRAVNLTDQVFDQILCSCVSLERMYINRTRGLVNAKNRVPHVKLKSLELYSCRNLKNLELLAPNLELFNYQGKEIYLCIRDGQKLASLRLHTPAFLDPRQTVVFTRKRDFIFNQFSSYLHNLNFLHLSVNLIKEMNDFTELCVFGNLKHLELNSENSLLNRLSYQASAFIMRVAPYLESLELSFPGVDISNRFDIEALDLAPMSPHQNLKEVKLLGFRGCANTLKFLTYVINYSVSLEKIDITARTVGAPVGCLSLKANAARNCTKCVDQLRQILPENIQLHFLEYDHCLEYTSDDDSIIVPYYLS